MFSDKENVNILTSLLVDDGICHAVVCPGSRNAPIVHNLNECKEIHCYPVTDERSAGFQAIGLSLANGCKPVVVCVTSGSALLNLCPAVAEAYYQQIPLVVISADRPQRWIGQLDGQTISQPDALGKMVRKAVSLPEVLVGEQYDDEHWYCNRLVNEALLACQGRVKGPVHINVPITEPLYTFHRENLPKERRIERLCMVGDVALDSAIDRIFGRKRRPLLIVGQLHDERKIAELLHSDIHMPILWEPLAMSSSPCFEPLLDKIQNNEKFRPDLVVYVGGHVVSKGLKTYLRTLRDVEQVRISQGDEVEDTFMHLTKIVNLADDMIVGLLHRCESDERYCKLWKDALTECFEKKQSFAPIYSSMYVVKEFFRKRREVSPSGEEYIFSGNSSVVRLMNLYADTHIYCNRGVNGIEGSLSAAVGFSMCERHERAHVYCFLGDLSFFYDQNALWNQNLNGNLRIIVLNNGGGAIFGKFEGLRQSQARETMVMAQHQTTAEGICKQNAVVYLSAHNQDEVQAGLERVIKGKSDRPMLLEVFTNIDIDNQVIADFLRQYKK